MSSAAAGDQRSDADLLAAHLAGDPEAFTVLVHRHRNRLWAVALRTVGNPEDAADGLQDGLLAAFRRADSYRGQAQVTTWLHRIVVNACLDLLRRRRVRAADPLPATGEVAVPGARHPTEESVEVGERRGDVRAALAQLPVEQRLALVLVDMEGYSVQEAAQILDCASGTVKSRCSRGRARLVPLLSQYRRNPTPPAGVQESDDRQPADHEPPQPPGTRL